MYMWEVDFSNAIAARTAVMTITLHALLQPGKWVNVWETDENRNRFRFGIPPEKDKGDFAFIQHMFASLNKTGQAAIICSQGILFQGGFFM